MNRSIVALVLVLLVLSSGFLESTAAGSGTCDSKCKVRCSKAGLKRRCLKNCGECCEKCKCVPPGTAASKDSCPCYRDMKNSRGKPKCP